MLSFRFREVGYFERTYFLIKKVGEMSEISNVKYYDREK